MQRESKVTILLVDFKLQKQRKQSDLSNNALKKQRFSGFTRKNNTQEISDADSDATIGPLGLN